MAPTRPALALVALSAFAGSACKSEAPPPAETTAVAEEASAAAPAPEGVPGASPESENGVGTRIPDDQDVARQAAIRAAAEFGMIGLMNSGAGGDPDAPTAPWGRDDSAGADPISKRGNMWGDSLGDSFGAGGLGLVGFGRGGGGEGIGLGSFGTIGKGGGAGSGAGYGSGSGRLGGSHARKPPSVRMGATDVVGKLPKEVIQRIVRQNFGRFRLCYEKGLHQNPNLAGKVTVKFVIGRDGSVGSVSGEGDLPDSGVVSCVTKAFYGLRFPEPDGGVVTVKYPIAFAPGDDSGKSAAADGSSVPGPKIAGKPLKEVTALEVEKALRDAGCTDVSSEAKKGSPGAVVFTVKKDGKAYTLTFVPQKAGQGVLPKEEIERLDREAAVRKEGAFFLAVEGETSDLERALLDAIVKTA